MAVAGGESMGVPSSPRGAGTGGPIESRSVGRMRVAPGTRAVAGGWWPSESVAAGGPLPSPATFSGEGVKAGAVSAIASCRGGSLMMSAGTWAPSISR